MLQIVTDFARRHRPSFGAVLPGKQPAPVPEKQPADFVCGRFHVKDHAHAFLLPATIYLCDCIILALQMMSTDIHALLYGILLIVVYTVALDKVLLFGGAKMQVKIISSRHEAINRLLAERIDCGTSLLHMETGYLHKEENMVLAVISNRDLPRVNQLILEVDPEAFIIVNRINEVRGRGFTLNKVYR